MKKIAPLFTVILLASIPAYAAHGTIRETETAVIVEYYGDGDGEQAGKEMVAAKSQASQSAVPQMVVAKSAAADQQPDVNPPLRDTAEKPSKYPWQKRKKQWKKPQGWVDSLVGRGIDGEDNY